MELVQVGGLALVQIGALGPLFAGVPASAQAGGLVPFQV